jgi:hypothetical protein
MSYRNFRERVFDPVVERSGFAPLTFHDLRHTHCAWLIDLGWSEFHIIRRMGWKDGRMLHSTYGHLLNRRNREAIEGLEKHWNRTQDSAGSDCEGSDCEGSDCEGSDCEGSDLVLPVCDLSVEPDASQGPENGP